MRKKVGIGNQDFETVPILMFLELDMRLEKMFRILMSILMNREIIKFILRLILMPQTKHIVMKYI